MQLLQIRLVAYKLTELNKNTMNKQIILNKHLNGVEVGNSNESMLNAMTEFAKQYHKEQLNLSGVSQWVAVSDRKPPEEWSNYIVCLENEAVFTANYYRIGSERWFIVGVGEITNENPVIYWMEEPKPPCG